MPVTHKMGVSCSFDASLYSIFDDAYAMVFARYENNLPLEQTGFWLFSQKGLSYQLSIMQVTICHINNSLLTTYILAIF